VNEIVCTVPDCAVVRIQIKDPAGIVASLKPELLLHPVVIEVQVIAEVKTLVGLVISDPKYKLKVTEGDEAPRSIVFKLVIVISTGVCHISAVSADVGNSIVVAFDLTLYFITDKSYCVASPFDDDVSAASIAFKDVPVLEIPYPVDTLPPAVFLTNFPNVGELATVSIPKATIPAPEL